MRKILSLVTLLWVSQANAGDLKYPVSLISEELKKNVDVVVRDDQMIFTIHSKNKATFYAHEVLTVLNENGNRLAKKIIGYNKLSRITDINAYVYDSSGKLIKRLKKAEIYDQAAFDGFSLYSDVRLKRIDLTQAIYPYTVEFEYEVEYDYLYSIPSSWWGGPKISHEHASYQLVYPRELEPHYKLYNIQVEPLKEKLDNGLQSITWKFENLKPNILEPNGVPIDEVVPHILVAPSVFEYDGYLGNMASWNDYGKWNLLLNDGRDQLPGTTKQKVKQLTQQLTSVEDKTRAIYEYLQSKTRYVSIQLGIGGLQPFPANIVDETGYGDCKALSNYTVAMLKEAGVKSYYTVIGAGRNEGDVDTDFPSHQFNHVIVAVPNGRDTLWLECTSQTNPFGYQGTFTEDRWALMITEDGGKLVRTINYKPEQNIQSRTADVVVDANGNARARIKTTAKGIQYENNGLNWTLNSSEKQKEWIEENTEIPNFSINAYSISDKKDKIPSAKIDLDLTLNRYATVSGKRLFISPNLMSKITSVPEKLAERKTDVVRKNNYIKYDTVNLSLPENLYPEFIPEPIKLNSKFGEYEASFKFDAGRVTYIRRMKVWKGRFPKETYNELVDFYKNVSKADNIKLVFLNKT